MNITRCPNCRTRFKVNVAQLSSQGGRVRCGRCAFVFNAREYLIGEADPSLLATTVMPRSPVGDAESVAGSGVDAPRVAPPGRSNPGLALPGPLADALAAAAELAAEELAPHDVASQDVVSQDVVSPGVSTPDAAIPDVAQTRSNSGGAGIEGSTTRQAQALGDAAAPQAGVEHQGGAEPPADTAWPTPGSLARWSIQSPSEPERAMEPLAGPTGAPAQLPPIVPPISAPDAPEPVVSLGAAAAPDPVQLAAAAALRQATASPGASWPEPLASVVEPSPRDKTAPSDAPGFDPADADLSEVDHRGTEPSRADVSDVDLPDTETPGADPWVLGAQPPPAWEARAAGRIDPLELDDPWLAPVPARRPWVTALLALGVLLALAGLLGQGAYHYRTELALHVPEAREPLRQACVWLGCTVGLPRRVELLAVQSVELQLDPEAPRQADLLTTLRNRAPYRQDFPVLEITLRDTRSDVVLRKMLHPVDYLPKGRPVDAGFDPNGELAIRLPVRLTGLDPAGLGIEANVFYP